MKMRALVCGLLLAVALPAFAADVDGKWKGSLDTPQGPIEVNFTFKADGAKLIGSTTGPDGKELALKNGKVDGDKISFTLEVDMQGNLLTFEYTGLVAAGQIKLHTDFMGQPIDYAVKKTT
jgi:hypothetical protein